MRQLAQYKAWLEVTPGVEALVADEDSALAVAQHYGMPTTFVDFTTEPRVAAYFASQSAPEEPGGMHSILCLQTSDLQEFWKALPVRNAAPEIIRVKPPDLWRLEAQGGVFLFCPYEDLERIYDLDRIIFPDTGPISGFDGSAVLPIRKSHLEIILDRFFMLEKMRAGQEAVSALADGGVRVVTLHRRRRWSAELVGVDGPPEVDSWAPALLADWSAMPAEVLPKSSRTVDISLDVNGSPRERCAALTSQITRWLASSPTGSRAQHVEFLLAPSSRLAALPGLDAKVRAAMRVIWDGLRRLPCPDEDIGWALGNCAGLALSAAELGSGASRPPWEDAAAACLGEVVCVEFGAKDGSYGWGYASSTDILRAVRRDLEPYLHPAYVRQVMSGAACVLQVVQAPERLFDFGAFARLFVREVVPTQVLVRPGYAYFFSPVSLDVFGLK
jgi:hypothetical protein